MKIESHVKLQSVLAVILTIFGLAMITAGFCCPPLAEISPSVLTALGEIFTFASACLGIDATYKIKLHTIQKKDGTKEQEIENQ